MDLACCGHVHVHVYVLYFVVCLEFFCPKLHSGCRWQCVKKAEKVQTHHVLMIAVAVVGAGAFAAAFV